MMRRCIFLLFWLLVAGWSWAQGSGEGSEKIRELERKIEELQKQIQALQQQGGSSEMDEIRRQVAILAEEIEKLRGGEEIVQLQENQRRSLGLGPSAAAVYSKKEGVSIAGYGEMLYENFAEVESDQLDFVRAIVYFGYRFNDRFLFNSEIEFEHGSTEQGGSVSVEFAHIDYSANENLTLRGGMVLVPMGLINEFHEPTVFLGARRPLTESFIIPSTWRENGFGVVGRKGMADYRAYLINGFDASGFSADEGLREGKQDGAEAKIKSPAFVGRVDVTPSAGLLLGGSLYAGNSVPFDVDPSLDIGTFIGEIHGEYKRRGFELRGLFAYAALDDVARLNQALGLTGDSSIGEKMVGGYLQAGYDLLAQHENAKASLVPYLRYESLNTQDDVPAGYSSNPETDRTVWTLGVQFQPIRNIVIKSDYQWFSNEADTALDQWNISLGYIF